MSTSRFDLNQFLDDHERAESARLEGVKLRTPPSWRRQINADCATARAEQSVPNHHHFAFIGA